MAVKFKCILYTFFYAGCVTPANYRPLPGLVHWTDIKVSVLGSGVGWTPAGKERTNKLV